MSAVEERDEDEVSWIECGRTNNYTSIEAILAVWETMCALNKQSTDAKSLLLSLSLCLIIRTDFNKPTQRVLEDPFGRLHL